MTVPEVFAVDAELDLFAGADPRAPGGEITAALCGHWEHEGSCRWPHNTHIDADSHPARLRTVVVVGDGERDEVARRIESALRRDARWSVVQFATRAINDDEHALAGRLAGALGRDS